MSQKGFFSKNFLIEKFFFFVTQIISNLQIKFIALLYCDNVKIRQRVWLE